MENLEVNAASLKLTTGDSEVQGSLVLLNATLTVEGMTANLVGIGTTTLTGSSLYARTGGHLQLPNATEVHSGTTNGDRYLQAESGGVLDLTNVTTLTSNTAGYTTYIRAYSGGQVLLPNVTTINNHSVGVYAQDANSRIDLSGLTTWNGHFPGGRQSSLDARTGTTIDVSHLATMHDVGLAVYGTATLPTSQITTFDNQTLTVNGHVSDFSGLTRLLNVTVNVEAGGSANLANVTDVTGSSLEVRGTGSVLQLPGLHEHHAGTTNGDRYLQAESGGVLDLTNVTTLTSNTAGYTTYIRAYSGGQVLLPNVTTINNHSVGVYAQDANSRIDLSGLTTWNGHFPGGRTSSLDARANTTVLLKTGTLATSYVAVPLTSGANLRLDTLHLGVGSSLSGTGTFSGNVVNTAGTINPNSASAGLTIAGNYSQGGDGIYQVDITGLTAGTQYDQLHVVGHANLDGTVRITASGSFPNASRLEVLSFGTRSGQFATVNSPDLGQGIQFVPSYGNGSFVLTVGVPVIPASAAATLVLPTVPGDGVRIDLFNNFGGGAAPSPASLVGRTPSGTTLSPFIDFPNPGVNINVGNSFNTFFASTTTPPAQVQGLAARNFTLRNDFFLKVSSDLDKVPATPEIDFLLGVGSDDGYHLTVGNQFIGSTGDRPFSYSWRWLSVATPGLYPVELLFAANSSGYSGLEFAWDTATSGGQKIVPQSALYIEATTTDNLITFEETANGTSLTDQYRNLGVVFNAISGNLQVTDTSPAKFVPVTPTHVFADPGSSPRDLGKLSLSFVVPGTTTPATTDDVSFYVIDAESTGATVTAFDPSGNSVFSANYHGGGGAQERVVIQSPRIARVEITLGQGLDTSAIDNLGFAIPTSLPDLSVNTVTPGSLTANTGRTLDVSWTTHNLGIAAVMSGWTERVWLSADGILDGTDRLLLTHDSSVFSLASAASVNVNDAVTLPSNVAEGTYYLIVETDTGGVVTEFDESNSAASVPITVTIPPLPDLSTSNVSGPQSANVGQSISVSWITLNNGTVAFTGTVTEQLYVSDDAVIGDDRLVGTYTFDRVGSDAPRHVTITLPTIGQGSGGNVFFLVKTDTANTVVESDEANNSVMASAGLNIPLQLTLTLPANQLAEDAVAPLRAVLTRNGSTTLPLVVSLTSSDTSELTVSASVTIPAGQASFVVELRAVDDTDFDGPQAVTITAAADGFASAIAGLTVIDDDLATLTIEISPTPNVAGLGVAEVARLQTSGQNNSQGLKSGDFSYGATTSSLVEGGTFTVKITRGDVSAAALLVALNTDSASQIALPASVLIPANAASVSITVGTVNDVVPEPTRTISIDASATNHLSASGSTVLIDDDLPTLTLELSAAAVSEAASNPALTGTVRRAVATSQALTVRLDSSDTSELLAPVEVIIPANQTSFSFELSVRDDALLDGPQTVELRAYGVYPTTGTSILTGFGSASVTVLDNEGPALTLELARSFVAEGLAVANTGTVTRNTSTTDSLIVALTSSDTTEATVPATVTIPAGQTSVTFNITTVDDGITDGTQRVTLTASADGLASGVATFNVSDLDVPDLVISRVVAPTDAATDQYVDVTFRLTNVGRNAAAGTMTERVLLSRDPLIGDDILLGNYDFTGVLQATGSLNFFERTVPIRLPNAAGDYWLVVVADVNDGVLEGLEDNNVTISTTPIHVQAAYRATVSTAVTQAVAGTPVLLTGQAFLGNTNNPAPFVPVTIHLDVRGFHRIISAITDSLGRYSTTFRPLPNEAGHYTVTASHPGSAPGATQDEFTLVGLSAEPPSVTQKLIESAPAITGTVTLRNLSEVPLTALHAEVINPPANITATVQLGNGTPNPTLPGEGTLTLTYSLTATNASIPSGQVLIRVTTAEGATVDLPVNVTIESLKPRLVSNPSTLVSGMLRGQQRLVEFTITNAGGAATGPLELRLPNVPWMSAPTGTAIPSIPAGQSTSVLLQLLPPTDLALGEFTGTIVVANDQTSLTVPFTFRNLSEAKGDLALEVVDEYTYYAEGAPRVADARVTLVDALTGETVFTGASESTGLLLIPNVTEGYYTLRVEASKHATFSDTILVESGRTKNVQAFLSRETVRYIWTVTPTEIEDRTKITIESTFEVNVPVPVIVVDPPLIDLSDLTTPGQTMQVEIIIRNEGLIAADNMKLDFGIVGGVEITPLIRDIGRLPAKSTLTIPVSIRRSALAVTGGVFAAAEDLANCTIPGFVVYELKCDKGRFYSVPIAVIPPSDFECGPASGSEGGGAVFGGGNGGAASPYIAPRVFETQSNCDCVELTLFEKDLSGWFKTPVAAANAALEVYTAGLVDVKLDVTAKGAVKLCCDEDGNQGLEFSANAGITATTTFGPGKDVSIPEKTISLRNGAELSFSGSLFAGIQASIVVGLSGEVSSSCNFEKPNATLSGTLGANFHGGLEGSVSGTLTTTEEVATITASVKGGIKGGVSITASYSTSDGLTLVEESEGIYLEVEASFSGIDYQYSPYDDPNTEEFENKLYFFKPFKRTLNASTVAEAEGILAAERALFDELVDDVRLHGVPVSYNGVPLEKAIPLIKDAVAIASPLPTETATAATEDDICARVRLQIDQDLVQTRDAFDARLSIVNQNPDIDLGNINVQLEVLDSQGRNRNDLFVIRQSSLDGLNAVDGTGIVVRQSEGSVTWLIIPTSEAALNGPTTYTVGGLLAYTEGERRVVVPLDRVEITVLPNALLKLNYFHQRDVLSDDPFTDEVEPSQPFNLAVMINNVGLGVAKDVSIASAQPKIIENEKGLLIDFQIIGTEVDGQNLTPSLTANFGDIGPGEIAQGRWLLTSTLQGQFIDYKATFEHVDGLGDKRLSLIDSVDIHELIHLVRAGGEFDDGKFDFLVNDLADEHDTPDTLWLSDGRVQSVGLVSDVEFDGVPTPGDLQVRMTVSASGLNSGEFSYDNRWNYFEAADPAGGQYHLVRVVRSDGVEVLVGDNISGGNAWQTDRTFIEQGRRPILENKLHLLDYAGTGVYTLYYSPVDVTGPSVTISGPAAVVSSTVESLTAHFSEAIDPSSFTLDDLVLTRGGGATNVIGAPVSIVSLGSNRYRIDGLGSLTDGEATYHFAIRMDGVTDAFGNAGSGATAVDWIKSVSIPAVESITGIDSPRRNAPLSNVVVTFTQAIDAASFSSADVSLTFVAAGGVGTESQPTVVPVDVVVSPSLNSGEFSYEVGGFDLETALDGHYVLTVNASGVTDGNGVAGLGAMSVAWDMDATVPTITGVGGLPTGSTRNNVSSFDLTFSEAIDPGSLSGADVIVSRNGTLIATDGLSVSAIGPQRYRIQGLSALTSAEGNYSVSVNAAGIRDLFGNAGVGGVNQTWTVDTTAPEAATDVAFVPDLSLLGAVDGSRTRESSVRSLTTSATEELPRILTTSATTVLVTNALGGVVTGVVAEGGVSIQVFDTTTNTVVGEGTTNGLSFSIPVRFATSGTHVLQIRVFDAAGNEGSSVFDLFIDNAPPAIVQFGNVPVGLADPAPEFVEIVFTEPVDATTLRRDDLRLTRDGGADLLPDDVQIVAVNDHTYRIAGLSPLTVSDGTYLLTVSLTGITDQAGNTGVGSAEVTWTRDVTPPQPGVIRGLVFNDVNGNRMRDPGELGLAGWKVYLDQDRSGNRGAGERFTVTDVDGNYVFDGLTPDTYVVAQEIEDGWSQTFPSLAPAQYFGISRLVLSGHHDHTSEPTATPTSSSASQGDFYTGAGSSPGYTWRDHDLATPEVIDVCYDFRSLGAFANEITPAEIAVVEQALQGWADASGGRLHFHRETDHPIGQIINIGVGDLAALGSTSAPRGTLGLGGGTFTDLSGEHFITEGKVWLDRAETWDTSFANGNVADTFDFFTVVAQEIGHALGLGHLDHLAGPDIMDGRYDSERTMFSANDRALIQALYSASTSDSDTDHQHDVVSLPAGTLGVHIITVDLDDVVSNLDFGLHFNHSPIVPNPIPNQNATEDTAFTFQFADGTFADVDVGDVLTYAATKSDGSPLPTWLTFDAATQTFAGMPLNADVETLSVKVTATDNGQESISDTFDIIVANTNDAPTVENPIPNQNATEDAAFSFQFANESFADVDVGDTLTYAATKSDGSPLPSWLTFTGATRTFSGTPLNADVGTLSLKVTATDSSNSSVSDTFDIVVANTNDAPTVANEILNQNATEDAAFSFQFASQSFADVDVGDTLTYSATKSDGTLLPSWLTFTAATRTFSGTPLNADVGTLSIKVTATDGHESVSDTFDIVVANTNDAPTVANEILNHNATEDAAFLFQFASESFADVDVGDTLTYAATKSDGSPLPSWLTFTATTRTFSGTPLNADVGTLSIKVTATDSGHERISETFEIVVGNTNDAPTVASEIHNQNATVATAFTFQFAGGTFADVDVGDVLTYSATKSNGSLLPSWLNFNASTRTFSGTPASSDVGTLSITVTATDGSHASVSDTFDFVVVSNNIPVVSLALTPARVTEDGRDNLVYTLTRTGPTTRPLTVSFIVGGNAILNSDFTASGVSRFFTTSGTTTGSVTFLAGQATRTVTINPTGDSLVESDETVILTVTPTALYTVETSNSATGTIVNDDPQVTLTVSSARVMENGSTNAVYTFRRTGSTSSAATINFSVGGTATFNADYAVSGAAAFSETAGSVTFAPGQLARSVIINPTSDAIYEIDETVVLTIVSSDGYFIASPGGVTTTIANDDTQVSVSVSPDSVTEDGGSDLIYTFTRSGITTGPLIVNFTVGGTASLRSDYSQSGARSFSATAGMLIFAAGETTKTIRVNPAADSTPEADETVILTVTPSTRYSTPTGIGNSATGVILNDDPRVTLAVSSAFVTENGSRNAAYTFTRTGSTRSAATVHFSVSGAATFNTDYTVSGATSFSDSSGTVTFAAGQSTKTVTINPMGDTNVEADETVALTLTSANGYVSGSPNAVTTTITNDDTAVTVAVSPSEVTENGSTNLVYTFTRNGISSNALTVRFTVGGTATFVADYLQTGASSFSRTRGMVTFAAGETTKTIAIKPKKDLVLDDNESVILTVAAGTGYVPGNSSSATGRILDSGPSSLAALANSATNGPKVRSSTSAGESPDRSHPN